MKKVLVLVEGQAEETFVTEVLGSHLRKVGVDVIPKLATTKRVKGGPHFKGGVVTYGKIRNDLTKLLSDTSAAKVTTMLDLYRLPQDFPGRNRMPRGSCYKRVEYLEKRWQEDILHRKFLPYLALYEFEAMVFTDPQKIAEAFPDKIVLPELIKIKAKFSSPEEINDQVPPSKRIIKLVPEYEKPLYGPLIILDIGLDRIRAECPHFDDWLKQLEALR